MDFLQFIGIKFPVLLLLYNGLVLELKFNDIAIYPIFWTSPLNVYLYFSSRRHIKEHAYFVYNKGLNILEYFLNYDFYYPRSNKND